MKNAPAINQETQNKIQTIQKLFDKPSVKKQLQMAIPKTMTVERLLRVAMTAIRTNPKLLECSQQSLLACIMGCSQLGLEPEPFLGQAYLVPYWSKKKKTLEAQLIPGYRGYITLARRSGEVQSVNAQVVYENDYFDLQYGLDEKLDHVPAEGDRGGVKGAYVIFRYKDGSHSFDYMTKDDIDKIRARSKSPDDGPWQTDYAEMSKKTVIRRHVKLAPLSVELAKTAMAENMALSGESQMDLFLPESDNGVRDKVILPTTDDFDKLASAKIDYPPDATLDRFLEETAKANDVSVDEIKIQATSQFGAFWKAFEAWQKKSQPKKETPKKPKEDPEKSIMAELMTELNAIPEKIRQKAAEKLKCSTSPITLDGKQQLLDECNAMMGKEK